MLCTVGIVAAGKSTNNLPAGTLISTYCASTSGVDGGGNSWSGAWEAIGLYANGTGGTYTASRGINTEGCYHPSGWYYGGYSNDTNLYWTHGTESGFLYVGYEYGNGYADGSGGVYNDYGSYITVADKYVVHQYTENDGNGYPTNYIARFDLSTVSIEYVSYIVAGTLLSEGCITLYDYQDAIGQTFDVASYQYSYADGSGGSYSTQQLDSTTCGALPMGFHISFSTGPLSFQYFDSDGVEQTFTYGTAQTSVIADGSFGSTVGASETINYSSGYEFYSYYDSVGQQTVHYHFNGINYYYYTYSI